jgi:hypothetical protein
MKFPEIVYGNINALELGRYLDAMSESYTLLIKSGDSYTSAKAFLEFQVEFNELIKYLRGERQ